ncbi:type II and III secretion system protein family protein [Phenylobacterium sp.]|uniref:type II and III secretion system protein family protein n=1 Tax=Phenylobacterium sp. TaxID=1871053 RepID=UPI002F924791
MPIGGSRILRFDRAIGRVLLGEPKVADVVPLSDRTLYVLGKAAGATNLTVLTAEGSTPIATMDIRVGYDLDDMNRAFSDLMPGEPIRVSARGDAVVLTGTVSSSTVAARAQALAESYAPERVVNLMSVKAAEQVMLSVHVAEVQRTALKQLGFTNITAIFENVPGADALSALPQLTSNPDALANILGITPIGSNIGVEALFEALERKGMATTLAEPKLTALSGETAVFFAGGEFPVPVPQQINADNSTFTIEYKQYGVSVGFTPTVHGDTINLLVAPEVSALDPANSVVLQSFRIPGLTTRRAKTTVELKNGQSFAIAGLIRRDFANNFRGLPGLADVPILGALFRSTGFQNNETEVVIIVTAHLAAPTDRSTLLLPTSTTRATSELDQLLTGRVDKPVNGPAPKTRPTSMQPAGGRAQ